MINAPDLSVILLHQDMVNKEKKLITTSLTLLDVHDIARSARTYCLQNAFIAHPSPALRKLAKTLKSHWEEGHGAKYNPNRKEALQIVDIVSDLDEAIHKIDLRTGKLPTLIATSAQMGHKRVDFSTLRDKLMSSEEPHLLMLGTGWGMSDAILNRAAYFLQPIQSPKDYNHLSVRSACAIMLDRLLGG